MIATIRIKGRGEWQISTRKRLDKGYYWRRASSYGDPVLDEWGSDTELDCLDDGLYCLVKHLKFTELENADAGADRRDERTKEPTWKRRSKPLTASAAKSNPSAPASNAWTRARTQ